MSTGEVGRAEFEAAYLTYIQNKMGGPLPEGVLKEYVERNSDGDYRSFQAAGAWWGWQASRAAVEVQLPEKWGEYTEAGSAACDAIDECRASIEAAGLRVKP